MLGNSGAIIQVIDDATVRKTGGDTDLTMQAHLCNIMYPLTPMVWSLGNAGYDMERLHPLGEDADRALILRWMKLKLETQVWNKRCLMFAPAGWLHDLFQWSVVWAPWMTREHVERVYSRGRAVTHYCLTHGDPTLANVMQREDGTFVLIDPVPPRAGMPSLKEVDCGKLLQSVSGWEGVRGCGKPSPVVMDIHDLVGGDRMHKARSFFWASVHCARVLRHGEPSAEVAAWAEQWSKHWYEESQIALRV